MYAWCQVPPRGPVSNRFFKEVMAKPCLALQCIPGRQGFLCFRARVPPGSQYGRCFSTVRQDHVLLLYAFQALAGRAVVGLQRKLSRHTCYASHQAHDFRSTSSAAKDRRQDRTGTPRPSWTNGLNLQIRQCCCGRGIRCFS